MREHEWYEDSVSFLFLLWIWVAVGGGVGAAFPYRCFEGTVSVPPDLKRNDIIKYYGINLSIICTLGRICCVFAF